MNLAHEAGRRSREAVVARDKEAWLAVFTDDAIVEDPIGPSALDPRGKGYRGRDAIAAFWDKAIAPTTKIEFVFRETYQGGNEEANVGHILITTGDYLTTAEGVFTYKANDEGKVVALRAYWEMDRGRSQVRERSSPELLTPHLCVRGVGLVVQQRAARVRGHSGIRRES